MWATNQLDDSETYINRMSMEGINGYHRHKLSGIGGNDGMKGLNEFLEEHVTYLRIILLRILNNLWP